MVSPAHTPCLLLALTLGCSGGEPAPPPPPSPEIRTPRPPPGPTPDPDRGRGLPPDFPLHPVTWDGLGGPPERSACRDLTHHPVILVHGSGGAPEDFFTEGGLAPALTEAGFGTCEIWAVRIGETGRPLRSLEELTDDLAFFIGSVLAYSGAPRVQLLAEGEGAIVAHAALAKYRLHPLVHAAVYVEGPFGGRPGCDDSACLRGEVVCCALRPGSLLLRRLAEPDPTPGASEDGGQLRYLTLGADPAGGWQLDGATNLVLPALATAPMPSVPEAWQAVIEALGDPTTPCDPANDHDGDGYCSLAGGGTDCDDRAAAVHPGADEIEADGIDQNCNGYDVDRRFPGWDCERPLPGVATPTPGGGTLPPEWRMARLSLPADGDWDAALARCRAGRFADEPMPDRHPFAEFAGPHYQDLGFLAPSELQEPWAAQVQRMIVLDQGCALIAGPEGPVLLARLQGSVPPAR